MRRYFFLSLLIIMSFSLTHAEDAFQGIFSHYQQYLEYYGLDFPGIKKEHFFIDTASRQNQYTLFVQKFTPPQVEGVVVFVHGYADHSGRQKYVLEYLLGRGFEVWLFDLPGHGLTRGGLRNGIDDFQEYAQMLHVVLGMAELEHYPVNLVAHSTGCSAILEHLRLFPDTFGRIILAAPLIFNASPALSYAAYGLLEGSVQEIPVPALPGFAVNDVYSKRLILKDPLQAWVMNMNYVASLYRWQKSLPDFPVMDRPITVIQGNHDNVVQWRDNLAFLKDRFPHSDLIFVGGAKHNLFMEHKWKRKYIFEQMDKAFKEED